MVEPIGAFFHRYTRAYLACDPTAFAPFFDLPCLIVDSNGDHVLCNESDLEDYERAFVAQLKEDGLREIEVERLREIAFGENEAFCSNRYRVMADEGRLIGDMEYHYVLQAQGERWRIKFARMGTLHHWTR